MKPDLCIYHHPCPDGFTAAWAVWKRWPDIEFVGAKYGDAPPEVAGKHVLIVDFSYKRDVLIDMGMVAESITILDHHKTAEQDLAMFTAEGRKAGRPGLIEPRALIGEALFSGQLPVQALFDMSKSGAVLAWEYCHGDAVIPRMVQHVQDRDLWRFDLPGSREVYQVQTSYPYDFQVWDDLANGLEEPQSRAELLAEGRAIERKQAKMVDELLAQTARRMVIGGVEVPVANLPYNMASDGAGKLAETAPFAATYFDRADGARVFSLRSRGEGADVSLVAAAYGGGGHANAAGFSAPAGWEGDAK